MKYGLRDWERMRDEREDPRENRIVLVGESEISKGLCE